MPGTPLEMAALCGLVFLGALVYSSGGHAGASAYLAAMALFSVAPPVMRPTALVMNMLVATIGTVRFSRAKAVPWPTVRALVLGSIPASFVGGMIQLPVQVYLPLLGAILLLAAIRLWLPEASKHRRPPPPALAFTAIGVGFGFLSGLTGIGGGIFLSPLLLLTGWEEPRRTGGAAAVFILVNSVLGFLGHASQAYQVPREAALLAAVAVGGGLIGSWLGANRLAPRALRRVHSVVLVISGVKLVLEALR